MLTIKPLFTCPTSGSWVPHLYCVSIVPLKHSEFWNEKYIVSMRICFVRKKIMYGKLKIECLLAQLHPYNLLPSMVKFWFISWTKCNIQKNFAIWFLYKLSQKLWLGLLGSCCFDKCGCSWPFYSYVLSYVANNCKWGWWWLCFDTDLSAFLI